MYSAARSPPAPGVSHELACALWTLADAPSSPCAMPSRTHATPTSLVPVAYPAARFDAGTGGAPCSRRVRPTNRRRRSRRARPFPCACAFTDSSCNERIRPGEVRLGMRPRVRRGGPARSRPAGQPESKRREEHRICRLRAERITAGPGLELTFGASAEKRCSRP